VEAMQAFEKSDLRKSFKRFEEAAAKRHEDSLWLCNVVKEIDMDHNGGMFWAVKKAFTATKCAMGWYWLGRLCGRDQEALECFKKSSDGGYSWGQVEYHRFFAMGRFVEKDEKIFVLLLEKAVAQNNPEAMYNLGKWYNSQEGGEQCQKALLYYQAAATLGWKSGATSVAERLYTVQGNGEDLIQAIRWGSAGDGDYFWSLVWDAFRAFQNKRVRGYLPSSFDLFAMELGKALYWNTYSHWTRQEKKSLQEFGVNCLDYYCTMMDIQQEVIMLFLLFWNEKTRVKTVGKMIGNFVWEGRYEVLIKKFGDLMVPLKTEPEPQSICQVL